MSSKGTIYDGDWANGVRHGYGVRSLLRDGVQVKEYSGGWVNDKKEVGTLYSVKNNPIGLSLPPFAGIILPGHLNIYRDMVLSSTVRERSMRGSGLRVNDLAGAGCTIQVSLVRCIREII